MYWYMPGMYWYIPVCIGTYFARIACVFGMYRHVPIINTCEYIPEYVHQYVPQYGEVVLVCIHYIPARIGMYSGMYSGMYFACIEHVMFWYLPIRAQIRQPIRAPILTNTFNTTCQYRPLHANTPSSTCSVHARPRCHRDRGTNRRLRLAVQRIPAYIKSEHSENADCRARCGNVRQASISSISSIGLQAALERRVWRRRILWMMLRDRNCNGIKASSSAVSRDLKRK